MHWPRGWFGCNQNKKGTHLTWFFYIPLPTMISLLKQRSGLVIKFDAVSGVLVCEAGCILEGLDNYLSDKGFMMPLGQGWMAMG
jgi:hypothetical protein